MHYLMVYHLINLVRVLMILNGLALKIMNIQVLLKRAPSHLNNLKDDLTLICLK